MADIVVVAPTILIGGSSNVGSRSENMSIRSSNTPGMKTPYTKRTKAPTVMYIKVDNCDTFQPVLHLCVTSSNGNLHQGPVHHTKKSSEQLDSIFENRSKNPTTKVNCSKRHKNRTVQDSVSKMKISSTTGKSSSAKGRFRPHCKANAASVGARCRQSALAPCQIGRTPWRL